MAKTKIKAAAIKDTSAYMQQVLSSADEEEAKKILDICTYTHVQTVTSTTWNINHNKNLQVKDVTVWVGDKKTSVVVTEVDSNNLLIEFSVGAIGTAEIEFRD